MDTCGWPPVPIACQRTPENVKEIRVFIKGDGNYSSE